MSMIVLGGLDRVGSATTPTFFSGGFIQIFGTSASALSFSASILRDGTLVGSITASAGKYLLPRSGTYSVLLTAISGQSASLVVQLETDVDTTPPSNEIYDVSYFGASPSASGGDNYRAMQAALAAASLTGGVALVSIPGTYQVLGSLAQPNFTEFRVGSPVSLVRAAGTNAPLIKNKDAAYLIQASLFTRASNVVTVTDASHTFLVGQKIYLPPARFTDTTLGGVITVTAVTSGSWSYASAGSNGAGGTSLQYIPVIPITRAIAPANLATVAVNAVNYIRVTDSVGDLPIGVQVYLTSDNAADSGFVGLVDVAVVTPTGWAFKVPNNTAGVPVGNLQLNYSIGTILRVDGTLDGNLTNQTPVSFTSNAIALFSNVSNHRLDAGAGRLTSARRCVNYFNPSNIYVDCRVQNTSVGVQLEGGHKRVYVEQITGASQLDTAWDGSATKQASDDFFALSNTLYTGDGTGGAQDYDNSTSPFGFSPCEQVTINVLDPSNAGNGLKITTDVTAPVGTVIVNSIGAYNKDPNPLLLGTAISIIDDGPHLSGTGYAEVRVGRTIWDLDFLGTISYRQLAHTAGGNCGLLRIEGLKHGVGTTGAQCLFQPGNSSVSSMTNNGTTCTIVHDGLRRYVAGQRVVVSGVTSDNTWNGVWTVAGVTNSTTLTITTSKATASTGTILMNGAVLNRFEAVFDEEVPAASGAKSMFQFGLGAIDQILLRGMKFIQGAGTSTTAIVSLNTFWNTTLKLQDCVYSAVVNGSGSPLAGLAGNHKNIILESCFPQGLPTTGDTTNQANFIPIRLIVFTNTLIPQSINIFCNNSVLKGANLFGDNGAVLGATTLNFLMANTECLNGAGVLFNFSGSATTQINLFASESCKFPTGGSLISTTPQIRLDGPIYANLSTLAGRFTGQVDGDRCISMAAVNGLPASAIRARWSATRNLWVSEHPVAAGAAVLAAGTVTVANTLMQSSSEIRIRNRVNGGTPGAILPVTFTAATNFVLTSTLSTDTSTLNWEMYGTN